MWNTIDDRYSSFALLSNAATFLGFAWLWLCTKVIASVPVEDTRCTIGMASGQVEDGSVPKEGPVCQKKMVMYHRDGQWSSRR